VPEERIWYVPNAVGVGPWTLDRRQAWNLLGADRETIAAGIRDPDASAFVQR
jgi:hypothetical protein